MDTAFPKFRRLFTNLNGLIIKKTRNLEVTVWAVKIITKTSIYREKDVDILDVTQEVDSLQEQLYFARKENGKKNRKKNHVTVPRNTEFHWKTFIIGVVCSGDYKNCPRSHAAANKSEDKTNTKRMFLISNSNSVKCFLNWCLEHGIAV
jgi:hypothetical protein